jgi:hypothetical protein
MFVSVCGFVYLWVCVCGWVSDCEYLCVCVCVLVGVSMYMCVCVVRCVCLCLCEYQCV